MRNEFLIAGIVLVIVGIALSITGYNKTQPTQLEKLAVLAERISGEKGLGREVEEPKTGGYLLLFGGIVLFAGGIALILNARIPENKNKQ